MTWKIIKYAIICNNWRTNVRTQCRLTSIQINRYPFRKLQISVWIMCTPWFGGSLVWDKFLKHSHLENVQILVNLFFDKVDFSKRLLSYRRPSITEMGKSCDSIKKKYKIQNWMCSNVRNLRILQFFQIRRFNLSYGWLRIS